MADSGIKRYSVKNSDLPPIYVPEEGYILRYRVVSEDKNRTSHWSPLFVVKPEYTFVLGSASVNKAGSIASVVWDAVNITKVVGSNTYSISKSHEYDIWVRWGAGDNTGDWIYKERIDSTSLSLPVPNTWTINGVIQGSAPNRFSVEIYLKGNPVQRADGAPGTPFLKVYRVLNHTV